MGERVELSGKVALVTGSSRGIGREIARELAKKGARVALHYRTDREAGACLDPKEDHVPGQARFAVLEKKAVEETRDGGLKPGEHFYYADEFNLSWMLTIKAIWGPRGQQVMIPTPAQPKKRYGIGAVDYHTGETVVLLRRRKRRREIAELLEALLEKHPSGRVYVAWDNSNTHEDDEVEAVVRGAAGRLILLYLPTYSPWLNPIEMLWRHFRREVTHCELFENVKALVAAAYEFFERYNRSPWRTLSVIGSDPAEIT